MDRLIPELRDIALPKCISTQARAHWAGALAELVEMMTSILTVASARKTGRLPAFRTASNDTITAICTDLRKDLGKDLAPLDPPATSLVFDRRFVHQMLHVWDGHTHREPEDVATYLCVSGDEYVVGIADRCMVDAIANGDDVAVRYALGKAERVIGVTHGRI